MDTAKQKNIRFTPRQLAIRIAVLVIVFAVLVYALLPWWLPESFIKNKIISDIKSKSGLTASIQKVEYSWIKGVQIFGLKIAQPDLPSSQNSTIVEIPKMVASFQPIRTLITKKFDYIKIRNMRVYASLDSKKKSVIARLSKLKSDWEPQHVSIINSKFYLKTPNSKSDLQLSVNNMQIYQGPKNRLGHLTLSAYLAQNSTRAIITARLTGKELLSASSIAEAEIHFENLELAHLKNIIRAPQDFAGVSAGKIKVHMNSKMQIDNFEISINATDLIIKYPAIKTKLPKFKNAKLYANSKINLQAGKINIDDFELIIPGIELSGKAELNSDFIESFSSENIVSAKTSGRINPQLIKNFFQKEISLPKDINLSGNILFDSSFIQKGMLLQFSFSSSAKDLEVYRNKFCLKKQNEKLTTNITINKNLVTDKINIETASVNFLENKAKLSASIDLHKIKKQIDKLINTPQEMSTKYFYADLLQFCEVNFKTKIVSPEILANRFNIKNSFVNKFKAIEGSAILSQPNSKLNSNFLFKTKNSIEASTISNEFKIRTADFNSISIDDLNLRVSQKNSWIELNDSHIKFNDSINAKINFISSDPLSLSNILLSNPQGLKTKGLATGTISINHTSGESSFTGNINLDDSSLVFDKKFNKPSGESCEIDFLFRTKHSKLSNSKSFYAEGVLGSSRLNLFYKHKPTLKRRDYRLLLTLSFDDANFFPELKAKIPKNFNANFIPIRVSGKQQNNIISTDISINPKRLQYTVDDIIKIDSPAKLSTKLTTTLLKNNSLTQIRFAQLSVGKTKFNLNGELYFKTPRSIYEIFKSNIYAFNMNLKSANNVKNLETFSPWLQTFCLQNKISGNLELVSNISLHNNRLYFSADLDATKILANNKDRFIKLNPFETNLSLSLTKDLSSDKIIIHEFQSQVGESFITLRGKGDYNFKRDRLMSFLDNLKLKASGKIDLQSNANIFPPRKTKDRQAGFFTFEISNFTKTPNSFIASANADNITFTSENQTVSLYGKISGAMTSQKPISKLTKDFYDNINFKFSSSNFAFKFNDQSGWANFAVTKNNTLDCNLLLLFDKFKTKELFNLQTKAFTNYKHRENKPISVDKFASDLLRNLRSNSNNVSLHATIFANNFQFWDKRVKDILDLNFLFTSISLYNQKLRISSNASIAGGKVDSKISCDLNNYNPKVLSITKLENISVTPAFQKQISWDFPGNKVTGFFSREENISFLLRDYIASNISKSYPLVKNGIAKMTATAGTITGQSAPDFIVSVFPHLNLTKYNYTDMTGFTRYHNDGSETNEMFFRGFNDIYMIGKTDINRNINYTVGLILLKNSSHTWLKKWKQGRVPLLKVSGKIKNGKLIDSKTQFPPADETLKQIFKNNIFSQSVKNLK